MVAVLIVGVDLDDFIRLYSFHIEVVWHGSRELPAFDCPGKSAAEFTVPESTYLYETIPTNRKIIWIVLLYLIAMLLSTKI